MDLAERLADYAASLSYSDLSPAVVKAAKERLADALGCALGAYREAPVRAARRLAERGYRGKDATLLGTRTKSAPDMAAFVNGLMVRYFDFNDTYLSKEPAHPSDNIPACLATAESEGRPGKDLLVAVVLAYEVQCRLCDAASLRLRGWDHVCYGLVSAALAAGKLMRLSKAELAQAVNISLNSHLAMRQVRAGGLSMWKGFSFSNAARNAVFSALLAREGITGPSPVFEGEMGFFKQVSGPFELDVASFGGKGRGFKLEETFLKFFPAEYHAQTAVWAALDLRERIAGDPAKRIERVGVETHEAAYTILGKDQEKWSPETRETADHSLPYIVSMALKVGQVDNDTYSAANLRDEQTLEFMKKVEVKEDRSFTAIYPETAANRVTLRLRSGNVVSEEVRYPRGHPKNPMTTQEVEDKFRRLTKGYLSEHRAQEILQALWNIEREDRISEVLELLKLD